MNTDNAIALALIAIVGGVITTQFKLLNKNAKNQEKQTAELSKIAKETKLARQAQEKGFKEAERRNGHLGEQNENIAKLVVQSGKQIEKIADKATKNIIKGVKTQHIKNQEVENQFVNKQSKDRRKEKR